MAALDPTPRSLGQLAQALGFLRIESLAVVLIDTGATAEVVGLAHRYPPSRRVSLRVAAELVRAGQRCRVLDQRTAQSRAA